MMQYPVAPEPPPSSLVGKLPSSELVVVKRSKKASIIQVGEGGEKRVLKSFWRWCVVAKCVCLNDSGWRNQVVNASVIYTLASSLAISLDNKRPGESGYCQLSSLTRSQLRPLRHWDDIDNNKSRKKCIAIRAEISFNAQNEAIAAAPACSDCNLEYSSCISHIFLIFLHSLITCTYFHTSTEVDFVESALSIQNPLKGALTSGFARVDRHRHVA